MTAREIIDLVCGRVRVNYTDPETDVAYNMTGEGVDIRCASLVDSFLDLEVHTIVPNDYEVVIFCNPPAGDPS